MSRLTDMFDSRFIPQMIESPVDSIIRKIEGDTETYICNRLMELNIDKDILMNQTQEIIRLNQVIAEYERMEEQGLLVKLPCAIGSDIYFIPSNAQFGLNILHNHEEFNRVYHQKIARLHFVESGWYVEGNINLEYGVVDRLFIDKSYKETWFLTQEEAEQELEKMKQSHRKLSEMCRN